MRFSTVFISSAVVLAGVSTAFATEKDDMLVARFADSDLGEVEARGFDEEPKLYARGGALSRLSGGNRNGDRPPSYRTAARDPPPRYEGSPHHIPHLDSFQRETDYSRNHKSPSYTSASNPRHRGCRSYYDDDELVARGNSPSKAGGGDKERKDGQPPKYEVAKKDPPPPYEGSPDHIPFLDSFQTETDYSNNHKSPTHHGVESQPHGSHGPHRSPSPHGSHGPHRAPSPHGSHGPHRAPSPQRGQSPHRQVRHRRSFYDLD